MALRDSLKYSIERIGYYINTSLNSNTQLPRATRISVFGNQLRVKGLRHYTIVIIDKYVLNRFSVFISVCVCFIMYEYNSGRYF